MADRDRSEGSGQPAEPTEKAPYAWVDEYSRYSGPMGAEATMVIGGLFLAAAVAFVITIAATWKGSLPWGAVFVVVLFGGIGGFVTRTGVARRGWRKRHPGVDPASTVHRAPGGSAFGPDTPVARVVRVVILVVCWGLAALFLLSLPSLLGGSDPPLSTASVIVAVVIVLGLAAGFALVGWYDLRRILQLRQARGTHTPG